jgi:hypothetical protein
MKTKKTSTEVQKIAENKLEMNQNLSVNLTKDDLFLVMQQNVIDVTQKQIENLTNQLKKNKEEIQKTNDVILEELKKHNSLPLNCDIVSWISLSRKNIPIYDFSKKKPSKERNLYLTEKVSINQKETYAQLNVEQNGFSGTLTKNITLKSNAKINGFVSKLNNFYKKNIDLTIEINELEYKIHDIENNKKFKSDFIKKFIVNNPDILKYIS